MARRRPPRPGALADLAPLRILTQIFLLQISYYGIAVILIVFTTLVAGQHPNPTMIFDWRSVKADVTTGWTLGLCWMLDALLIVIPLLLLIARSKLVPDFALTIHLINLVITSLFTRSIPDTVSWWFLQFCSSALMIALGMWACQWRELRPMAFGGKAKQHANSASLENGQPAKTNDNTGFAMGTGQGRGEDGAGSYEMVGMPSREGG